MFSCYLEYEYVCSIYLKTAIRLTDMKRNAMLEAIRKKIPPEIDIEIDLSFDIADRIDYLLQLRGLTHIDLAARLGVEVNDVCQWLRGLYNFDLETIAKIQTVLGEPIIEVVGHKKELDGDE